ncbi:ABC transporter ATP-binding protein [Desulfovibrio psychrotolerans]|uniref:ABC transporter ATP-binding protein n=1 Tax=Desulfovibrio psychrotolerans TaxID=415242 RepID=A0A7J0BS04_9BACT|nr:ABC transporter ATP-binding protein [Desulfovibrio psychrotolerans]
MQVENIHLSFRQRDGLFSRSRKQVLKGVSLSMENGECLGLIGESGSGKSTLGRVITGTARPDRGTVRLMEQDIYAGTGFAKSTGLGGRVSIVFQDYNASVNPYFSVRDILEEPLRGLGGGSVEEIPALAGRGNRRTAYLEQLLEQVRLPASYLARQPHELSGGELQRVCIARALAARPPLILLDEAVSSLDVSVQYQVLQLLKALKEERNLSYLFISHDLTAVTYLCDRILFFNDGAIVEQVDDLEELPRVRSGYARQLLEAVLV